MRMLCIKLLLHSQFSLVLDRKLHDRSLSTSEDIRIVIEEFQRCHCTTVILESHEAEAFRAALLRLSLSLRITNKLDLRQHAFGTYSTLLLVSGIGHEALPREMSDKSLSQFGCIDRSG